MPNLALAPYLHRLIGWAPRRRWTLPRRQASSTSLWLALWEARSLRSGSLGGKELIEWVGLHAKSSVQWWWVGAVRIVSQVTGQDCLSVHFGRVLEQG